MNYKHGLKFTTLLLSMVTLSSCAGFDKITSIFSQEPTKEQGLVTELKPGDGKTKANHANVYHPSLAHKAQPTTKNAHHGTATDDGSLHPIKKVAFQKHAVQGDKALATEHPTAIVGAHADDDKVKHDMNKNYHKAIAHDMHIKSDLLNWTKIVSLLHANVLDTQEVINALKIQKNLDLQDKDGLTILMHALRSQASYTVINAIVSHGANVNLQDKDGKTALVTLLEYTPNYDMAELLLKHGASVTLADSTGNGPYDYLAEIYGLDKEILKMTARNKKRYYSHKKRKRKHGDAIDDGYQSLPSQFLKFKNLFDQYNHSKHSYNDTPQFDEKARAQEEKIAHEVQLYDHGKPFVAYEEVTQPAPHVATNPTPAHAPHRVTNAQKTHEVKSNNQYANSNYHEPINSDFHNNDDIIHNLDAKKSQEPQTHVANARHVNPENTTAEQRQVVDPVITENDQAIAKSVVLGEPVPVKNLHAHAVETHQPKAVQQAKAEPMHKHVAENSPTQHAPAMETAPAPTPAPQHQVIHSAPAPTPAPKVEELKAPIQDSNIPVVSPNDHVNVYDDSDDLVLHD